MTDHESAPDIDPVGLSQPHSIGSSAPLAVTQDFSDFYRNFVPTLVGFLVFQGAQLADAAEITQDTMMKAYRRWDSIDSPKAWSRRVASRELVRRLTSVEEPAELAPQDTALLPASFNVEAWEQRHTVLGILATLPPRQRQVMAWTYDGYTPAEIAAELALDPATVRANLLKARRALASRLRCGSEGDQA